MLRLIRKAFLFFTWLFILSVGFCAFLAIDSWSDVILLRKHYPVIQVQGKSKPPKISFDKKKPASWVSLDRISPMAIGAVLVSEDWAFYQHKGYDPKQIREAVKENLLKHKYARGASTITQQVVKNVFLESKKSLWRKVRELVLAICLEKALKKDRILEVYLNIAEWGEGIYGIQNASRIYFEQSPATLDAKQGAFLAMLLPNPRKYSVSFRNKRLTPFAEKRVDNILGKMVQAGYLGMEEAMLQAYAPLSFEETMKEVWPAEDAQENDLQWEE